MRIRTSSNLAFVSACLIIGAGAHGATVGFTQDFNQGMAGFDSFSEISIVRASGGVGGDADAFLEIGQESFAFHVGVYTPDPEFVGNLLADGVTGFTFWLRDVGTDDNLEIHVGVGASRLHPTEPENFWLSLDGFAPTDGMWTEYSVDITDPSRWVQIRGSGTFADALQSSDRLLFRHDLAPFGPSPNSTTGDFGLDRITVVPEPASLLLILGGAGICLRRRIRQ